MPQVWGAGEKFVPVTLKFVPFGGNPDIPTGAADLFKPSPPQAKESTQRVEYCCLVPSTLGEATRVRSRYGGKRQGFTPEAPEVDFTPEAPEVHVPGTWVVRPREDAVRFRPGSSAGRSTASTRIMSRNGAKKQRQRMNKRTRYADATICPIGPIADQSINFEVGTIYGPSIIGEVGNQSTSTPTPTPTRLRLLLLLLPLDYTTRL